jgi:hypothetical protein
MSDVRSRVQSILFRTYASRLSCLATPWDRWRRPALVSRRLVMGENELRLLALRGRGRLELQDGHGSQVG